MPANRKCVFANEQIHHIFNRDELEEYRWLSYPEYINPQLKNITNISPVMNNFKSADDYRKFVLDQVLYAREIEKIKHLMWE